jgi:cytochrome c biogenesis protein CcmG, thiol:disulfide interchange protein DsbE
LSFRPYVVHVFLLAALLLTGCTSKKEGTADGRSPEGEGAAQLAQSPRVPLVEPSARRPAPDIQATGVDGTPWRLGDRKGKVVIVDFWATWCGPCRRTIPHLIDLQKEHGGRGLEILGISLDRGGVALVSPFIQQTGINYPIIVDGEGKWANQFGGVEGIPTFFLIDRSGRIAGQMIGALPKESIVQAVESLLKES